MSEWVSGWVSHSLIRPAQLAVIWSLILSNAWHHSQVPLGESGTPTPRAVCEKGCSVILARKLPGAGTSDHFPCKWVGGAKHPLGPPVERLE